MQEQHPDYYAILGLTIDATEREINKAFRVLALKYHPDKNPDPKAQEIFIQAKRASEFLLNAEKRAEYDAELRKKQQREQYEKERVQGMDDKRRSLKEKLAAQEQAAKAESQLKKKRERNLASLREEGQRRKEQKTAEEFVKHREQMAESEGVKRQIKVKWRLSATSHSDESLYQVFKQFGAVEDIQLVEGKANSAIITFVAPASATAAVDSYAASEDWRVSLVGEKKQTQRASVFTHNYASSAAQQQQQQPEQPAPDLQAGAPRVDAKQHSAFEAAVLEQMRLAAERQRMMSAESKGGDSKPSFAAAAATAVQSEEPSSTDVPPSDSKSTEPRTAAAKSFMVRESDILARMMQQAQKSA